MVLNMADAEIEKPATGPATIIEDPRQMLIDRINGLRYKINIADDLDEDTLQEIGERVVADYDLDIQSRSRWQENMEEALNLARQLSGDRKWAGENLADVKYPIISIASIQFNSRAYPNIVKGRDVVKCQVVGNDPDGMKAARAENIRQFSNYQIIEDMSGWEEGMDKLLIRLPILGLYYKKIYNMGEDRVAQSDTVSPENLVVNYYAKSLEPRATEIVELIPNEVLERVRGGRFLDVELGKGSEIKNEDESISDDQGDNRDEDEDAPHVFLEQHRWWDLDGDGYQEPYVITVHKETAQIVRITARYGIDDVQFNDNGEIVKINPFQHYIKYSFFPSFDDSFYDIGWGILLAPINSTINSTINQLLDAGTINNRQGGFIGRGIRMTRGGATASIKFKMGEWKQVESKGDDLRKGIVPLPTKPPSPILFKLLGLMIEVSDKLASQAEVLSGEQPKANVPATTTLALIEQGLKVFSGIYKRIHRSLKQEFITIRHLNKMHLTDDMYQRVLDNPGGASVSDFSDNDLDIVPVSDSAEVSDVQRLVKAEALMEKRGQGLKDGKVFERWLEALQVPNHTELLPDENDPPPPDPPEIQIEKMKLQQKDFELQLDDRRLYMAEVETQAKIMKLAAEAVRALADAEAKEVGPQLEMYMKELDFLKDMLSNQQQELQNRGIIGNGNNQRAV
jgi:chaperonin GroES